jgi:copper homeostasis protein (lipoprotein)
MIPSLRLLTRFALALALLSLLLPRSASAAQTLAGEMIYFADAARFTDCASGRSYPISMEGDFLKMQEAYRLAAKAPGAPVYVTFEGLVAPRPRMEGEGKQDAVIVRRFLAASPQRSCARATASLENTHWRIVRLGDSAIPAAPGEREPHLLLSDEHGQKRASATVGCNQIVGGFIAAGASLRFTQSASTRMACPPPLDVWERKLIEALAATRQSRVTGNTLEFLNAAGAPVALFEAVYF